MGDDFLLLLSARFEPGRIDVDERVGLNLLLPVALLLPLERMVDWLERFEIPRKWMNTLADNADSFAAILVGAAALKTALARVPKIGPALTAVAIPVMTAAIKLGGAELKKTNQAAQTKQDYMTAILTQFKLDLEQGVNDDLLSKPLR